jgi:hypothetical protein
MSEISDTPPNQSNTEQAVPGETVSFQPMLRGADWQPAPQSERKVTIPPPVGRRGAPEKADAPDEAETSQALGATSLEGGKVTIIPAEDPQAVKERDGIKPEYIGGRPMVEYKGPDSIGIHNEGRRAAKGDGARG